MILMKDIIKDGHPTLRKKASLVKTPLTKSNINTIRKMTNYLRRSQNEKLCDRFGLRPGVGIAAPQINVSKRMLCILVDDGKTVYEYAIINPIVLAESVEMTYLEGGEGCLSVPDKFGVVLRHKKIKVKATFYDYKTNTIEDKTVTFTGYLSVVFQHEYDHLNGILFTDRVTNDYFNYKPVEF